MISFRNRLKVIIRQIRSRYLSKYTQDISPITIKISLSKYAQDISPITIKISLSKNAQDISPNILKISLQVHTGYLSN